MPQVSVIIPTYNRAHLIGRCIASVQRQTFADWELIVSDDGSTDNTREVVEALADPRIQYVRQPNGGAARARNGGVAQSRGGLITFLDSDDEADARWLEKLSAPFADSSVGVVCCGVKIFNKDGLVIKQFLPDDLGVMLDHAHGRFTTGGVFMVKRSLFEAVGGYDPQLRSGQHTELSFRLVPLARAQGFSIVNLGEYLIRQNFHGGERITTNPRYKLMGSVRTLRKHRQLFSKDPELASNYLSVAAISAIKLGKVGTGRKLLGRALGLRWSWLLLVRYLLTWTGPVRKWIWQPGRMGQHHFKKWFLARQKV